MLDTWRFDARRAAGIWRAGDLGACDPSAPFLVGEIDLVSAPAHMLPPRPPGRRRDRGCRRSSRPEHRHDEGDPLALGRATLRVEDQRLQGPLAFDMEKLNELQVLRRRRRPRAWLQDRARLRADHPLWEFWWPPGHIIGWGETFVHGPRPAPCDQGRYGRGPYGDTFEDGYRAQPRSATNRPLERQRAAGDDQRTAGRRQACGASLEERGSTP